MKKLATLLLLIPGISLAQVELKTDMYEVIEVQKADGKSKVEWVQADNIIPGDKVGYRISFTNTGEKPAENIVLNNPIPDNTIYVADSARGANSKIEYSVNSGSDFGQPNQLFIEKDGKKLPAKAKDYTNVRWTLTKPLASGASGSVQYVVQVK